MVKLNGSNCIFYTQIMVHIGGGLKLLQLALPFKRLYVLRLYVLQFAKRLQVLHVKKVINPTSSHKIICPTGQKIISPTMVLWF